MKNIKARQQISNQEYLKKKYLKRKNKCYLENRMINMMLAMFYVITGALRNERHLSEPIPYKE